MATLTTARPARTPTDAERARLAQRRRRGRFYGLRTAVAIAVSVIMFFPVYYMVVTALSTQADVNGPGLHLWPAHFTWGNFTKPLDQDFPLGSWVRNSTVITLAVTVITVVCNLLAGYAFAKIRFRGRSALFLLLLSTMMVPVQAIMVAQYKLAITLGLYGKFWSVILPESATVFGIFLARQFFVAIPDELIEAARVDGAGALRTFVSIVLPLCRPLIAVLTLLTALGEWNAYSWPLVALFGDHTRYTLPLGITTDIQGQFQTDYPTLMAVNLLSVLPMVVLFVAFQRYFVQGLSRSGIK